MVEPIDIWRTARQMVDAHGIFAPQECRENADAAAASGDCDGEVAWEIVRRTAERMLENGLPQDVPGLPS
jgi:hypothetical protein